MKAVASQAHRDSDGYNGGSEYTRRHASDGIHEKWVPGRLS